MTLSKSEFNSQAMIACAGHSCFFSKLTPMQQSLTGKIKCHQNHVSDPRSYDSTFDMNAGRKTACTGCFDHSESLSSSASFSASSMGKVGLSRLSISAAPWGIPAISFWRSSSISSSSSSSESWASPGRISAICV